MSSGYTILSIFSNILHNVLYSCVCYWLFSVCFFSSSSSLHHPVCFWLEVCVLLVVFCLLLLLIYSSPCPVCYWLKVSKPIRCPTPNSRISALSSPRRWGWWWSSLMIKICRKIEPLFCQVQCWSAEYIRSTKAPKDICNTKSGCFRHFLQIASGGFFCFFRQYFYQRFPLMIYSGRVKSVNRGSWSWGGGLKWATFHSKFPHCSKERGIKRGDERNDIERL